MKKQFFRVKQLADQTFLKADKSDAFNHKELQIADQKVEYVRAALNNISKRLPLSQASEGNIDKRMKKYAEYQLGQAILEQGHRNIDSECKLLQAILRECALVELELAKEQADHELKVELMVSAPLQGVVDNDLPNILKQKRNLTKYILDKDSASNRYHSSKNGTNREALRDDMEEADSKVEQHRDILAAEMFTLLRRESELSQYMLQLLKLQRAYHESALKNLEKVIPTLEQQIGDSSVKTVFGLSLEEHLRVSNRRIAYPLEVCVCALTESGMSEEGLFRVAGGAARVKRLKLAIDSGCFSLPLLPEYLDVHVLASALKSYLRELPEPLLTYILYNEWMDCVRYPEEQRLTVVKGILRKLPQANRDNLTYLVQFFAKLSKNLENKMSASNIAIVISPNLLWNQNKELDMHMVNCATLNSIVELFINNVEILFPDNLSSFTTIAPSDLFAEEPEFVRPVLPNVKLISHDSIDYIHNNYFNDMQMETASPKPQVRRKAKLAPTPPVIKADEFGSNERVNIPISYPSGSTTLNRVHKSKPLPEDKAKYSDTDEQSSQRRQSLVLDTSSSQTVLDSVNAHNKINESQKLLVNLDDTKTVDIAYVSQPPILVQQSRARPIQQITAQTVNIENVTIKPKPNSQEKLVRPVAAPRTFDNTRNEHEMNKSFNEIDIEGEVVEVRRPSTEALTERPKPVVPVRPASLKAAPRTSTECCGDPALQKTQCSMYSVAHKQQPSYVNIQSNRNSDNERFLAGHDMQMAEKEKFLGHQPEHPKSTENKCEEVNFNHSETVRTRTNSVGSSRPEIPSKSGLIKSTERLNSDSTEMFNGNSNRIIHMRTQSDGNIVDVGSPLNLVQTPPSPRSLNKPTQPPPPPPITNVRQKNDYDSTDL